MMEKEVAVWQNLSQHLQAQTIPIQMFISAFAVSKLFEVLHVNSTLIKVIVDTIIFVINFVIQREWVFKKK